MKRWSKCWRRVVNRVLAKLFVSTNWHAWVGEKSPSSDCRNMWIVRENEVKPKQLRKIGIGWSLFGTRSLAFQWTINHDPDDTFTFHIAVPYLFGLYLSFDVDYLDWVKGWVGAYDEALYGFKAAAGGLKVSWCETEEEEFTKFAWFFDWRELHGKPKVSTTADKPLEVVYTQPADKLFPLSTHDMLLIPETTRWTWPRFWKKDKVRQGYQVSFDNPPPIPARGIARMANRKTDGIYGVFIEACSPGEAVVRYREMVLRERGLLTA